MAQKFLEGSTNEGPLSWESAESLVAYGGIYFKAPLSANFHVGIYRYIGIGFSERVCCGTLCSGMGTSGTACILNPFVLTPTVQLRLDAL